MLTPQILWSSVTFYEKETVNASHNFIGGLFFKGNPLL